MNPKDGLDWLDFQVGGVIDESHTGGAVSIKLGDRQRCQVEVEPVVDAGGSVESLPKKGYDGGIVSAHENGETMVAYLESFSSWPRHDATRR